MLSLDQLAQYVNQAICKQNTKQFQIFLTKSEIFTHQYLVKIIADILASNIFSHNQKTIAAISLNFIFIKRLDDNYLGWIYKCWDEYFLHFMQRNQDDIIDWIYIAHTKNALQSLLSQIPDNIAQATIQKYNNTTFVGKLMLLQSIKQHDQISFSNQLTFVRQTIQDFINDTCNIISNLHALQVTEYQHILFESDIMLTLFEWVSLMKTAPQFHNQFDDMLFILGKNSVIVNLVKQELKSVLELTSNGKIKYKISENVVELYDNSMVKNTQKQQILKFLRFQLNIKAYSIGIIQCLASAFQITSDLTHFDSYPTLSILQLITPIIINQLAANKSLKKQYLSNQALMKQNFNLLLISMLSLLNLSSQFIFLLNILSEAQYIILYEIFSDYLRTTSGQINAFKYEDNLFIANNQSFIQISMQACETPKQACGQLIKSYFQLNNKAQIQYIQFLIASLRYRIFNQDSQHITSLKQKQLTIPTVENIYLIINRIYFFLDKSNKDLLNLIYSHFIEPQYVFSFQKLQKVRIIHFLQYSYVQYFKDNIEEGGKFIKWAEQTKQNSQIQLQIFCQFIEEVFQLGGAEMIWSFLLQEIQNTKKTEIIRLIKRLIEKHGEIIDVQRMLDLIQKISNKIKKQFNENKQNYTSSNGNHHLLYKCLHIAQILSQNHKIIQKQGRILQQILSIVDFFNEQKIQYLIFSQEIVKLLNNIVNLQQVIPIEFERYLNSLSSIVTQNKKYGIILETYYLLLLKGRQTFQEHPQFLAKIQSSIQEKILDPTRRQNILVIQSAFLLQNIYLVYPDLIKENRDVFVVTETIYELQKQNVDINEKLVASILLYWMAGQFAFGNYNLGKLSECKIQIFKDQFGLMFALNLKKLIQKYYDTQSLQYLLKLSIKLLDFEHFYKNQKNYKGPQFSLSIFKKKYLKMDSFEQISMAVQYLREHLDRDKYGYHMQNLKKQIGQQMLTQLLSTRVIENRKQRSIIKVKRID